MSADYKVHRPHFELVDRQDYSPTMIVDTANNIGFASLAETGFGLPSSCRALGQRVCDWLNSLPPEEVLQHPLHGQKITD